jgi:hypothetical protein
MVQTSPTSYADEPHVPGATAVRVIGVLLILLGGFKLVSASYLYLAGSSLSLGKVFSAMNVSWIVLFLVSLIVIARWHPPRLPGH